METEFMLYTVLLGTHEPYVPAKVNTYTYS